MQLLSLQSQISAPVSTSLLAALQDIVSQVEIESRFCIRHPDYKPLELPSEAVERFEQLPIELQDKYLSLQLQNFLYGIYYNGFLKTALALEADSDSLALQQNLENNTFLGVDLEFYERLHQSNNGEGHFDSDWQVLRQESDGSLAVTKRDLILHIEPQRHLPPEVESVEIGDLVAIRLPKNRVQNGFYMAVGNAGFKNRDRSDTPEQTVRIYFNLSPEGAVAVMSSLTRELNAIPIPFTFKVLYNPPDYERHDSGVLYFDRRYYDAVCSVLQTVYAQERSHFKAEVPLFTKLLAPGLALAEEPDRPFSDRESFGTNRCQIVANGLVDAWQKKDNSPEGKMKAICQQFSLVGIELSRPYLNANSEDIYTPLNL